MENKAQFKLRDLIAAPIAFIGGIILYIAIVIGGIWTSVEIFKALNDDL